MHVDLTPIVQWGLGVANLVLVAAVPIGVAWISKKLKLQGDAAANAQLNIAAQNIAGLFSKELAAGATHITDLDIANPKIAAMAQQVIAAMPDSAAHLGVTQQQVATMIVAKIGTLLATGGKLPAPAPAPVPVAVVGQPST